MSGIYTTHLYEKAAMRSLPGVTPIRLDGRNSGLTTTYEPLWEESATKTVRTAAIAMTISSASANDTAAGTGARTVSVTGVTSTGAVATEVLTMNGQTGVSLTNTYFGINKMEVLTAGSGLTNAGIIYVGSGAITTGKPAVVDNLINFATVGYGRSNSYLYTVPTGKVLLILDMSISSRGGTASTYDVIIKETASTGTVEKIYPVGAWGLITSGIYVPAYINFKLPLAFPANSTVQGMALGSASTGPIVAASSALLVDLPSVNSLQSYF